MIGPIDFSLTPMVTYALILGTALPVVLAGMARIPGLSRHNARQFLAAFLFTILVWVALVAAVPGSQRIDIPDLVVALMILGGASLVYLEAWALLSRGYTLGLLLTLHRAAHPVRDSELAALYRGGAGLSWIMRHRMTGLVNTGLVSVEDGHVTLRRLGTVVATLCKYSIIVLGLRKTG